MNRCSCRFIGVFVLCLMAQSIFPTKSCADQIDPRIEKVLRDWKARQGRVKSVRYVATGEMTVPKGALSANMIDWGPNETPQRFPLTDLTASKKMTMLLDFGKQRHRVEKEEAILSGVKRTLIPRGSIRVFDGKQAMDASPRELNPDDAFGAKNMLDVGISKGNLRGQAFGSDEIALFIGHGYIPLQLDQIIPGRFEPNWDSESLVVHGNGVHRTRTCLVLRTDAIQGIGTYFDEIWVDTARESAVVRLVSYVDGRAGNDLQVDYQDTEQGWLPHHWSWNFRPNGHLLQQHEMTITEMSFNPTVRDADFTVEVKPGMFVAEYTLGGSPDVLAAPTMTKKQVFHIDEDGSWNEIVNGVEVPASHSRLKWFVMVGSIGGAMAFLLLIWFWRKRKRNLQARSIM